jgi:replicative DNA helicase
LRNNSLYEQVSFLKKEDFFQPFHGKLFQEIVTRTAGDKAADKIIMSEFFNEMK